MHITRAVVRAERDQLNERATEYVAVINDARDNLGTRFDVTVDPVSTADFRDAVDTVFDDGNRAVNVAALIRVLRELDVTDDYPGFIVDELLGRELAAAIAGGQPRRTLAEATFHFIDIHHHSPEATAGLDDLEAGVAAGFQTRLPGWPWERGENPFAP